MIKDFFRFYIGYAEKERQLADQRQLDRKTKTRFAQPIPIIHFNIGVTHWNYDEISEEGGY
jgi:hypothetical protein